MKLSNANQVAAVSRGILMSCGVAGFCLLLTACEDPPPRSFTYFMEDRIAREGTLVRCNENPDQALRDIECANASRAMAVIALRQETERLERLERESEQKLEQMREEMNEVDRIAREIAVEVARQEREAYEQLWRQAAESGAGSGPDTAAESPGDSLSLIELPSSLRGDQ